MHARFALDGVLDVQHRFLWLVVDLDQFRGVLRHVPVVRHDDGQRLTRVACDLVRCGQVLEAALDAGGKRPRHRRHVGAGQHADHPGHLERRRGVKPADPGVRDQRAEDCGVPDVRNRIEIVDEAALSAQQRLVFQARQGATHPRLRCRRDGHGAIPVATRVAARRTSSGSGPPGSSSERNASSTARGSQAWRLAAIVSGS